MSIVHPGESYFRVFVYGRKDVSFLSLPVFDHRIQTEQEAGYFLSSQFGNLLLSMRSLPFSVDSGSFLGVVIDSRGLNHALHLPVGYALVFGVSGLVFF